jgi:hypothetical protein
MFGGDIGTGAGAIIHNDGGTAQVARQRITQGAREKIAGTTGRETNHKPDGSTHGPRSTGLRGGLMGCGGK